MHEETKRDLPTAEQLSEELKRLRGKRSFVRMLQSTTASLIVVAALAFLASSLFLPVLRVTGSSMAPTLLNGELILCSKVGKQQRGDVAAFYFNNKVLLKRVIGVAGDEIAISEDGTVTLNGEILDEPYINEQSLGECDISFPYRVPEGRIFVMGDHRAVSIDSRSTVVGCVADEYVIGKVVMRLYPFRRLGKIN